MSDEKRIVEINGAKVEVDMRTAKSVETFKVGDPVKVLKKDSSTWKMSPGVIIDFVEFKSLPTIAVARIDSGYYGTKIEFEYINAESEGIEIAPAHKFDIEIDKADVIQRLNNEIEEETTKIKDLERKKTFFLAHFAKYFKEIVTDEPAEKVTN